MDGSGHQGVEEPDRALPNDGIDSIPRVMSPAFAGDITFAETPGGFEIRYSERLAHEHQELVDQSADWLENEMGALNLGQIDHDILIADGVLTSEIKNGILAWWAERVEDLELK
jgi:hypothetical protein